MSQSTAEPLPRPAPLLELDGISKSFGEIHALEDAHLVVGTNEIVGLLGDNGAGKSTLIKIVTGYHSPDRGRITWKGEPLEHLTVQHARALGIETVYQERALADQQSLWRNIFMGRERVARFGLLDVAGMRAQTETLMREFLRFTSKAVTPETYVGSMSGGERQGVAIARALHFEAELIILDEPTMGLSVTETRKTLDFVREIKAVGKSCIFIDHNIFNVHQVVDRVVVIDRGRTAGQFSTAEITVQDLIARMQHLAETGSLDGGPAEATA
jgi:simple sugar transport system ATP-binding protein